MIPGTWFKWYVTDAACRIPIYFFFVGRMLTDSDQGAETTYVLDSQWRQRLYVNESFINWLLPLDTGEVGKFQDEKKFKPRSIPEKPKHNPLKNSGEQKAKVAAAVAGFDAAADQTSFPRLFGPYFTGQVPSTRETAS